MVYDIYIYKVDSTGSVLGITQLMGNKDFVSVYPNPSAENITFKLTNQLENCTLKITDINGKEIISKEITNNEYTLTQQLEAGVYFYTILGNEKNSKGKFVVIK